MYVTGVMYTVVGWCDENVFDWCGQLFDVFGMDPELIQYAGLVADKKHKGIEADQDGRYKENKFDMLCPAQTERNREIIFAGVMMGDVGSPPEPFFMGDPMRPIVAEVNDDEAGHKRPPCYGNFKRGNVPEEEDGTEGGEFE